MEDETERELLSRYARCGDGSAFHEIVRRHAGLVLGVTTRITGRPALAEEVAQDAFALLAARATALLRGNAPLAPWLHRTARFKALRAAAAETRRARTLERFMKEPDTSAAPADEWAPLLPHLDAALDALPPADREVLLLHFHGRVPHADIAARLGVRPEAARQRCSRAVSRLAGLLRARLGSAVPVSVSLLTAGLSASLSGPAPAEALAAGIARSALAAAPSVSGATVFANVLHTMNLTHSAALTVTAFCLSGIVWQEIALEGVRSDIRSLTAGRAGLFLPGESPALSAPDIKYAERPGGGGAKRDDWLADLRAGRLTPKALMEFAGRFQRARAGDDPAALPGLAGFAVLLRGPLLLSAAEMSASLDMPAEDKAALWDLLLGAMAGQPEESLKLASHAWSGVPEKDREKITSAAVRALKDWVRSDSGAAAEWYRRALEAGQLTPGFLSREPAWELAGALFTALPDRDPQTAAAFLEGLPPAGRAPALEAAVRNTKSPDLLRTISETAGALPEADRALPLSAAASRLAQSSSLKDAAALFSGIPFPDEATRASAAVNTATASAINRNASSADRQDAAWEWLSRETAAAGEGRKAYLADYLTRLAGGDPAWALARFESLGGGVSQEALGGFLEKIPAFTDDDTDSARIHLRLAEQLTDPAARAKALERHHQPQKSRRP